MKLSSLVVPVLGTLLLVACSSDSSDDTTPPGNNFDPTPPEDMQTTWTVSGTVTFPTGETATNLKVVASRNSTYPLPGSELSNVVLVSPTGTPAMANFQLNIDVTDLDTESYTGAILYLYEDINNDNDLDIAQGELYRKLKVVDITDGVWSDGNTTATYASFGYFIAGTVYEVNSNSYTIQETGWYYSNCDSTFACQNLISSENNVFQNAKLTYDTVLQN